MRTPARALAQPRRGPWAHGPTAVGLQRVGRPTAGHLRAGRQAAEARPAGPPAVEQVCFNILSIMLRWNSHILGRNVVRNVPYFVFCVFVEKGFVPFVNCAIWVFSGSNNSSNYFGSVDSSQNSQKVSGHSEGRPMEMEQSDHYIK